MGIFALFWVLMCGVTLGLPRVFGENSVPTTAKGAAWMPPESVVLTVVMYHAILNSRTGTYIVSERQLDDDLYAYEAAGYTTVFPCEVIAFVNGTGNLPEKPLLITFDDGHYNNLYYGLPLLKKHGMKANINIIGAFSAHSTDSGDHSNPNYSHLTWEQIKNLSESGNFEIGNHTYNMHNYQPRFGVGKKAGESEAAYRDAVRSDVGKLQGVLKEKSGVMPVVFAYPFGKYTLEAKEELISLGFRMMLNCNEGVTRIVRGEPETLYNVRRINRAGGYATQDFINKMEKYRIKKLSERGTEN